MKPHIPFSVLSSIYYKENPLNFNECMISIWHNQTTRPTEMVLVEDGPLSIELKALITKWSLELGSKLKLISLEKNIGLGPALNEGLKACSNEWVFRMDTDDICTPDRFEKQLRYIQKHPNIALLGGQIEEFSDNFKNTTGKREVPIQKKDILKYAEMRSPFNHPSVAYKKSAIQELKGYHDHPSMEDYNLWIRFIMSNYMFSNLPDTIVYMRTDDLHSRRRGFKYIKSEWQLYKLKKDIKYQSNLKALLIFIARSSTRLLPAKILQKIYNTILRK